MKNNHEGLLSLTDVYAALNSECSRLGQKEFARQCGVSQQFMNRIINGHKFPSEPVLTRLGFRKAPQMFERTSL